MEMKKLQTDIQYKNWLAELKTKVRNIQIKAAITGDGSLLFEILRLKNGLEIRNWGERKIESPISNF